MALVRGHDPYSLLEIIPVSSWNTETSPSGEDWMFVSLIGEGVVIEPFTYPKNRELGQVGAVTNVDTGRQVVRGSFTVYPRYNAKWFWQLIGSCFSCEHLELNQDVEGQFVQDDACNAHLYIPQAYYQTSAGSESGVSPGFTFRLWKSGQDTASGYFDKMTGVVLTGFQWTQPDGNYPECRFDFVAPAPTPTNSFGFSPATAATDEIIVGARDLTNSCTALAKMAFWRNHTNTVKNINLSSFSFTYNNGIEMAPGPANDPESVSKPGHVNPISVEFTLEALLAADDVTTNQETPYQRYLEGQPVGEIDKLYLRYVSYDETADDGEYIHHTGTPSETVPYGVAFSLPHAMLLSGSANVDGGGTLRESVSGEGIGVQSTANVGESHSKEMLTSFCVQTQVANGATGTSKDEDSNAKFLPAACGGNDAHTDQQV